MGIYSYNLRSILEVKRKVNGQEEDLDQKNNDEPEDVPEDNPDDEHSVDDTNTEYTMDDTEGDNTDDNTEDTTDDNQPEDGDTPENDEHDTNDDSTEYTMDDTDGGEDGDTPEDGESDMGDDTGEGDDMSGDNPDVDPDSIDALEKDLFKDLSEEEMTIKVVELKNSYIDAYTTINNILIRANKIPKNSNNSKVLEFIINKLMELSTMIQFYISNTFETKTYIENSINYEQYLATLNTINKLFKEIIPKKENIK